MVEWINLILAAIALASGLGAVIGTVYGVSKKTIIETLVLSNKTYSDRNKQLEEEIKQVREEYMKKIHELEGRIQTLEKIKTPPLKPLIELVTNNHTELMEAIHKK